MGARGTPGHPLRPRSHLASGASRLCPDTDASEAPPPAPQPLDLLAAECADSLCGADRRLALAAGVAPLHGVGAPVLGPLADQLQTRIMDLVRGVARAELEFARLGAATPADALRAARARCDGPALRRRFPLLEPLAARLEEQWVAAAGTLLGRLQADAPALARHFPGADGAPTAIASLASDPHDGGQSVCRLTFASGTRVVYKPRPVDGERIVHAALAALDPGMHPLPRLAVLARGAYGWMEHADTIERTRATPRDAWQLGAIAAVAYALGLEDLHADNVLLTAGGPVVVDGEVCLGPMALLSRATVAAGLDRHLATATHLLPKVTLDRNGRYGLLPGVLDVWWPGEAWRAALQHYERGYAALWRRIAQHGGEALHRALTPIVAEPAHVRVVVRNTATYNRVLNASLRAGALYSGQARAAAIAVIGAQPPASPLGAWIAEREMEALERMDVPSFYARVDTAALLAPRGGVLVSADAEYPDRMDVLRARCSTLTPGTLATSLRIGRVLVRAQRIEADAAMALPAPEAVDPLAVGDAIARRLLALAEPGRDGTPRWYAPYTVGPAHAALDRSAFVGSSGILLFLAAAHASGLVPDASPRIVRLLADERRALERDLARPPRVRLRVLSRNGLLGRCAALAWSQRLLADALPAALRHPLDALVDAAFMRLVAAARGRPRTELMDGLGGAALARLACAAPPSRGSDVHAALAAVGDRLAARARAVIAHPRVCRGPALGLAHGLSGLCVALDRLAPALRRPAYAPLAADLAAVLLDAAMAERQAEDAGSSPLRDSWCNGSVGLLAATMRHVQGGTAATTWRALRDETLAATSPTTHTVCCGRFGLVALAAEAGPHALDAPALARSAYAAWWADGFRCGAAGWYAAPGLYQGVAGIGYACLQVAARTPLPSLLRLEWPGAGSSDAWI